MSKSLLEQLAEHDQRIAEAHERVLQEETQRDQAKAEAARLSELLTDAFSRDDQAAIEKLTRTKLKAVALAGEPWAERVAGAQRAALRMSVERDTWRAENVSGLLSEVTPAAQAAAQAVTDAIRGLEEARRGWHAVSDRVSRLIEGLPGQDPRAMPPADAMDQLIRDLRRGIGEVPLPLPRALQTAARVVEPDDPRLTGKVA